jgi:ABC-type xylose transport system permease subunit
VIVLSVLILFSLPMGLLVGLVSRCSMGWLIVRSFGASLALMLIVDCVTNGLPSNHSIGWYAEAAMYSAIPFSLFVFVPCLAGAMTVRLLFGKRSKNAPNQLPDPTSPSVTPPARAGDAPSVAADH